MLKSGWNCSPKTNALSQRWIASIDWVSVASNSTHAVIHPWQTLNGIFGHPTLKPPSQRPRHQRLFKECQAQHSSWMSLLRTCQGRSFDQLPEMQFAVLAAAAGWQNSWLLSCHYALFCICAKIVENVLQHIYIYIHVCAYIYISLSVCKNASRLWETSLEWLYTD